MFKDPNPDGLDEDKKPKYSAWDEEGLPTKDAAGEPLTKSAGKKVKKEWEKQKKLFSK